MGSGSGSKKAAPQRRSSDVGIANKSHGLVGSMQDQTGIARNITPTDDLYINRHQNSNIDSNYNASKLEGSKKNKGRSSSQTKA